MVTLHLSLPASVNLKPKLPILGLFQNHHQPPLPKLPSTVFPGLSMTSSPQPQDPIMLFPPANQSVAAIVFGDGSDSRLYPLTKRRSEGAIPIAANYRLIDAVVSNCINSNINKIYALTQFNSTSLNSHLTKAYSGLGLGKEGFVEVIAAYQNLEDKGWFQGTADAIKRCLWVLEEYPVVEFLVLPGHHLYRMDYQKLIEAHRNKKADVTCAVLAGAISLGMKVHAYCFDGYWEDMRSIKAFPHRLTQTLSFGISFYDKDSPLYTLPRHLPPSLITDATENSELS